MRIFVDLTHFDHYQIDHSHQGDAPYPPMNGLRGGGGERRRRREE